MNTVRYTRTIYLPTAPEFAERFPQYGPRAQADGVDLFNLVMQPEVFVAADVVTTVLGYPAAAVVAGTALVIRDGKLSGTDRQYVGALICTLMEANGYQKTGRKRSIPHPEWSRGEVYETAA